MACRTSFIASGSSPNAATISRASFLAFVVPPRLGGGVVVNFTAVLLCGIAAGYAADRSTYYYACLTVQYVSTKHYPEQRETIGRSLRRSPQT